MVPLRRLLPLAALLVAVLTGCGGGTVVDTSVDNSLGFQPGNGAAVVYKAGHRHAADAVSGTTLAGTPLDLASLRGKIVVVNFWSSDCGPCHGEAQGFNQVARDDASKGVAFVGIDERDDKASARHFEQSQRVPYPSIFDPSAQLTLAFPGSAPSSTPATLVLDRQGKIAARVNGAMEYTQLNALVNHLIAEPA
jgi:thiol-disulfide isomerase/thioredoxin